MQCALVVIGPSYANVGCGIIRGIVGRVYKEQEELDEHKKLVENK